MITPEHITSLHENEVFVFGSNEIGYHGAGAALTAARQFGAIHHLGFGHKGQSFAIPTKDWRINTLPLNVISHYVQRFIEFARINRNLTFLVTEIGCGLAGYTPTDIAPMFRTAILLPNVYLPQSFWDILKPENIS